MSVNKYDPNSKTLTALSGQRVWVGTKADRAAAIANHTMPNNVLVCITDDEDDTIADEVLRDDPRAVTGGAVYDELYTSTTLSSVKGDGVKTRAFALSTLYAKLYEYAGTDIAKFLKTRVLIEDSGVNALIVYSPVRIWSGNYYYSLTQVLYANNAGISTMKIGPTSGDCGHINGSWNGTNWTFTDIGSNVLGTEYTWSIITV